MGSEMCIRDRYIINDRIGVEGIAIIVSSLKFFFRHEIPAEKSSD